MYELKYILSFTFKRDAIILYHIQRLNQSDRGFWRVVLCAAMWLCYRAAAVKSITYSERSRSAWIPWPFSCHIEQGWATGGPRATYGPHPHSVRPAHNFYLIKRVKKKNKKEEKQTHVSSLLRNNISHERFPLKSPLQLLQLPWSEYHACWVWVHLVVALNVGPLFFSFVTSLNDDVCEPFALIKILTNHVAFWAWKTWNECMLVQSTYHT